MVAQSDETALASAYLDAVASLEPDAAYYAVDDQQRITYWSPGAERLLGHAARDVVGKHCSVAIHCMRCSTGCGLREHGLIRNKTLTHYHADGRLVVVDKQAKSFEDADGRFMGGVEILRPLQQAAAPQAQQLSDFYGILTADREFLAQLNGLRHVANTQVNVLVRGESGSGKELVAKAIHAMSPRAGKPFVAVNCGTLSREFLQSELFGHKRGAFTGAVADKEGLLAQAHGGTLFLDEVAELPTELQAMLLRFLQERRYRPLGSVADRAADVRIISATHVSLRQAVAAGKFREDLMFRLRVVPVFLPPLRERRVDIPLLWHRLLAQAAERNQLKLPQTSAAAMDALMAYRWPGNVRELINVTEFVSVTRSGQEVLEQHLPPEFSEHVAEANMPQHDVARSGQMEATVYRKPELTAETINATLVTCDGNTSAAAKRLGVSRATLWRWRRKLGLD